MEQVFQELTVLASRADEIVFSISLTLNIFKYSSKALGMYTAD